MHASASGVANSICICFWTCICKWCCQQHLHLDMNASASGVANSICICLSTCICKWCCQQHLHVDIYPGTLVGTLSVFLFSCKICFKRIVRRVITAEL